MSTQAPGFAPTARPYRRFITPSMHRRVTNAAILNLALCFVQAVWLGGIQSFWGFVAGNTMRTVLLFLPVLAIYVLRVGNMHVGKKTSSSTAADIGSLFTSWSAARSLLWYIFSAWFFSETYLWSSSTSAGLSAIDFGKSYERPRLNERPIFLRSLFMCLGAAQCFLHLLKDYDRIPLPARKIPNDMELIQQRNRQPFLAPLKELKQKIPLLVHKSLLRTLVVTFAGPVFYWLFIRQRAWSWTFWLARYFYTLPKASKQPTIPPLIIDLLGRFVVEGFLLTFSWEFANTVFDLFLAQEPMKQGRLLTDESNDPNGSLLNGLKTARPVARSFAFWELALIAANLPQRRQLMFQDLNRAGGSVWSQLHTICLGELHAVVKRIQEASTPTIPPTSQALAAQQQQQQAHSNQPKVASSVRQDNILAPPKPVRLSQFRGQSPNAYNVVDTSARKAIEYAVSHAPQHEPVSKASLAGLVRKAMAYFITSPLGIPFRMHFAQRASSVIFGHPYSNLSTIVDATTSISKLVVHSKKEDRFGTVYHDIPNIIRTFTSSYAAIERYVQTLDVHWTDVGFQEQDRVIPDVKVLLQCLRDGLKEIVNEFGEYADDLGLGAGEIRAAKQVVAVGGEKKQEMRQVNKS